MKSDKFIKSIFFLSALVSTVFVFGIILFLFKEGLPIFKVVSIDKFFTGKFWYPTYEPPDFGILPLIAGTLVITAGATIFSVLPGIGTAIYIAELSHPKVKEFLKPIIELLAAIPSVIYGFFGMVVLSPFIQRIFNIPIGLNAFTASILLGIMAVPTIITLAEDAITSVPNYLREASYALGATKWDTITKVVIPAGSSGILNAIILGIGRAIGETMTVLMVAGGAAVIPKSIFSPVRTITATIAAEMGEAPMQSDHYHALFGIAIVLFSITTGINLLADYIKNRRKMT
jgi:phosphate transport system permease protein